MKRLISGRLSEHTSVFIARSSECVEREVRFDVAWTNRGHRLCAEIKRVLTKGFFTTHLSHSYHFVTSGIEFDSERVCEGLDGVF